MRSWCLSLLLGVLLLALLSSSTHAYYYRGSLSVQVRYGIGMSRRSYTTRIDSCVSVSLEGVTRSSRNTRTIRRSWLPRWYQNLNFGMVNYASWSRLKVTVYEYTRYGLYAIGSCRIRIKSGSSKRYHSCRINRGRVYFYYKLVC